MFPSYSLICSAVAFQSFCTPFNPISSFHSFLFLMCNELTLRNLEVFLEDLRFSDLFPPVQFYKQLTTLRPKISLIFFKNLSESHYHPILPYMISRFYLPFKVLPHCISTHFGAISAASTLVTGLNPSVGLDTSFLSVFL